jgi:hypothetical protein
MMSIAVSHNSIDLVNILLRHTLYKDDLDKAIFKSIDNNNIDIVKTIGKKFSIVDFSMHACMVGSVEILQFLLNTYGEPVDLKKLMFEHAVSSGSCEMVRFLLKRGVEYWSPNALCTAIEKRNFQVTKLLLSCTDKIHDLKKAMIEACKVGSIDTVKLLIDMGVKVQSEIGDHLLYTYDDGYLPTAVNYNQIDMVNFLLDNGANIDGPAQVILQLAIQNATVKMVKLLITRGATITRGCIREAIRKWAWKRDKEILELLLTYKIDNEIIKSCLSEAPEEVQKILTNYMLQ